MEFDEFERYLADLGQRPVVVGYNGTAHAREALVWAAGEAARRDVPLLVVYAANYPGMAVGPGPGLLDLSPRALDAAEEVTAQGVAEAMAVRPGLRVVGATEVTSPTQTLVLASASAGLVVIGTRGHGRVVGTLLGSVAFTVAARARCPVVVVRTGADRPAESSEVVVGTDGSPGADCAVRFAADHADATGRTLRIVTSTGEEAPGGVGKDRLHAAAQEIAEAAGLLVSRTHPGLPVTTSVEHGPADRAIVDASATAGLVVVGTRGRGAFRGLLLGSVSHAVIHGARCPVAVVDAAPADDDAPPRDAAGHRPAVLDVVDVWGHGSFPASDPPANW